MKKDDKGLQALTEIVVKKHHDVASGPDQPASVPGSDSQRGPSRDTESESDIQSKKGAKSHKGSVSFGGRSKAESDGISRNELEFDSFTQARHARLARISSHKPSESGHQKKDSKSYKRSKSTKSNKSTRKGAKREEFELDDLASDERRPKKVFYKQPQFWMWAGPAIWTILLCFITIMLKKFAEDKVAGNLPFWRFTLFFGLLPPIYLITNYILLALVLFFESQFFTTTNVLYFVVALKAPARWVIMSILLLPLYIPLFSSQASLSSGADTTYHRILSFIACLIIFTAVNLLKVLIAKLLSSYFHSSTHFVKMQEALDKEYYLKILATPSQGTETWMQQFQEDKGKVEPDSPEKPRNLQKSSSLVSKLSNPLKRSLTMVKRRAASLPNIVTMDTIDESRVANVEAQKQGLPEETRDAASRPPAMSFEQDLSSARVNSLQPGFEPPDPVPPTPVSPWAPASPFEGAHLSRPSVPVPGVKAGSTILPQSGYRHFRSFTDSKIGSEVPVQRLQIKRSNSDGAKQMASFAENPDLKNDRKSFEFKTTPPSIAAPRSSNFPRRPPSSQTSKQTETKELGKSTLRSSDVSNSDVWGWKKRNNRTPSVIKEEAEPESPTKLPAATDDMTNEQGVALVSTIHQVEKHIRKNQIGLPFMRQISKREHNSELEAKKLAFFIFWNVKPSFDRNYVILEDIQPFFPERKALEAFAMLDQNGDGQVTLAEMRLAIQDVFSERQNLSMQLKDTKSVVGTLELVVASALHILAIFFYLMIFGINIQQVWVLFTSIFVGFAFIFGNSIKNLFEAVLYLFVQHPFDVGDILMIEDDVRVKVEEIALSTITMRRADGVRLWVPMTLMVPKTCQNISRSDNKADSAKFLVDVGVSAQALQEVDKQVGDFIDAHEIDFSSGHSVHLTASADPLKVALVVGWEYSHNGVDGGRMGQSKSDILQVISDTLAELQVLNTQAPVKSHP